MGFGKLGPQMSEINVTPLVDVMLVLLIIFMVTAPLMQRGVNVDLPRANAGAIKYDEKQLMVTINPQGQIQLQGRALTLKELEVKLSSIHKDNPEAEVYLSADRKVQYEIVVQTIAVVKAAGISRLGMVTEPLTIK